MEILKEIFRYLSDKIGKDHQLYLVGGSSRDFLLNHDFTDFDFATDLTPSELSAIFPSASFVFKKFGIVDIKYFSYNITLATLRKEEEYVDSRHPNKITFVNDVNLDFVRRDFTINAIYIDAEGKIIDPTKGVIDLNNKKIRMIGNIEKRIKEDPLRILRAYRFMYKLDFTLEEELKQYLEDNFKMVAKLNPQKIRQELKKCDPQCLKFLKSKFRKEGLLSLFID